MAKSRQHALKLKRNRRRKTKVAQPNPAAKVWRAALDFWSGIDWARLVAFCSVGAAAILVYVSTLWVMNRPIDAVVINGSFERVSAMQVEDALYPLVQTGFLNARLKDMRNQLLSIPWVANASVRRRWPGTIEVAVDEELPAARWGKSGLLNIDGELFVKDVTHVPAELPILNGPTGSEQRVAQLYFEVQGRLQQIGMSATELHLDERGAWELQLNSGIRIRLGARAIDARIDRLFDALNQVISARAERVEYIDMRYTNGFAIGWKDDAPMRARAEDGALPNV